MWVHLLPGRVRARIPGLRHSPAFATLLQERLADCAGVHQSVASPVTGTVLITYDPAILTFEHLAALLFPSAQAEVAAAADTAVAVQSHAVTAVATATKPARGLGLTTAEVMQRKAVCGANVLAEPPRPSFLRRLLDQYNDVMQLTLVAGAGLSLLSGHRRDALTIGALLLLNGLIGASQAGGNSRSLEALRSLNDRPSRVIRDGVEQLVPPTDLVPGDLVLLEEGDWVPADLSLVAAAGLAIDESLLTGECAAVQKSATTDRLWAGTAVVGGRGSAVVIATGMDSTLGRIAALLARAERPAPVQQQLNLLGRRISRIGLWLAAGVISIGLLRGQGAFGAILAGVSLAISAIPEGLPTFTTLALSAGARRLAGRHGTFQSLAAVERMGAVTALCFDKTGTLTQGEMSVTEVCLPDALWQVTGTGYTPDGEFMRHGKQADPLANPALLRLLKVAALCNNARLGLDAEGALVTHGDPTEIALLVAALKAGIRACGGEGDRLLELPFDAVRRCMTVICRDGVGQAVTCTKGAPEAVLPRCTRLYIGGGVHELNSQLRRRVNKAVAEMAARGLRVLAVAFRPVSLTVNARESERNLVLLGLVGMTDPPRPEAAEAIRRCHGAGVRVIMITGDHPVTAATIAEQLGMATGQGAVLTGGQVSVLSEADLDAVIKQVVVVARATPEQKLQVVRALRRTGQVVAMTGDGVNDAPAMREADVGIAMGDRGTEVARATAGLVLDDDHLQTVVDAIEQGRATRGNVQRTARYLLGVNAAEVCLMAASLLLGLPLPLLPVQLLWMNLVGDGLPATALGAQPPEPGLMHRLPERSGNLLAPDFSRKVMRHGIKVGLAATGLYVWAIATGRPLPQARTLAMVALTAGQIKHLHACRSRGQANQVGTAGKAAAALTLAAIYLPPIRNVLQFTPLGFRDLALATGAALAVT